MKNSLAKTLCTIIGSLTNKKSFLDTVDWDTRPAYRLITIRQHIDGDVLIEFGGPTNLLAECVYVDYDALMAAIEARPDVTVVPGKSNKSVEFKKVK